MHSCIQGTRIQPFRIPPSHLPRLPRCTTPTDTAPGGRPKSSSHGLPDPQAARGAPVWISTMSASDAVQTGGSARSPARRRPGGRAGTAAIRRAGGHQGQHRCGRLPTTAACPGFAYEPTESASVVTRWKRPARSSSARPISINLPPALWAHARRTARCHNTFDPRLTFPAARVQARRWPWLSASSTSRSAPTPRDPAACRPVFQQHRRVEAHPWPHLDAWCRTRPASRSIAYRFLL